MLKTYYFDVHNKIGAIKIEKIRISVIHYLKAHRTIECFRGRVVLG